MPTKVFTPGEILTAADTNAYLANRPLQNAVINGGFDIWQRGTTSSSNAYLADRFLIDGNGTTTAQSRQTFTPGAAPLAGLEANFFHRSVVSSVAGDSHYSVLQQRIEDVRTLAGQTVTLSFYAKADASKPISLELEQIFGSGGSSPVRVFAFKPTITTSWARYSTSITLPSISDKTIGSNSFVGFNFWFDAGSAFNSRTSSLGQQSGTFDIWGVQLEAGTVANDFRRNANSLQGELAACQRYYYQVGPGFAAFSRIVGGFYEANNVFAAIVPLPVQMRVTPFPSVGFSGITSFDGINVIAVSSVALNGPSPTFGGINCIVSGATQTRPGFLAFAGTDSFISFSAEL